MIWLESGASDDGLIAAALRKPRHLAETTHVVRGYDDQLGQALFEGDYS